MALIIGTFTSSCAVQMSLNAELMTEETPPTVPTITLDNHPAMILAANAAAFTVDGTCAVNGNAVDVTADSAAMGSTTCAAGVWSLTMDLSAVADGTGIVIEASHSNPLIPQTVTASVTLDKDTAIPTSTSIVVDGGNLNTPNTAATLTLAATDAAEMYITQTSGCSAGGAWEAYATSKAWTLTSTNALNTVYVKFRTTAGNESACISDSIYHGTGTVMSESFDDASALHPDITIVAPTSVSGGALTVPAPVNAAGTQYYANEIITDPAMAYLSGATITLEVTGVTSTSTQAQSFLYLADNPGWRGLYILKMGSLLYFAYDSPAWSATTVTYNAVTHRWWRIRHDSATNWVYWETSPDNVTWTTRRSLLSPVTFTWMHPSVMSKTFVALATPGGFTINQLTITR